MTPRSHARPQHEAQRQPRRSARSWAWRIGTPTVVLLSGALFVVSATNSEGTDLRPGRYTDLAGLVSAEADQTQALTDQVAKLQQQINQLTEAVPDGEVKGYQRRVDRLKAPAGLTAETGPGLEVTLSDSPTETADIGAYSDEAYVVHQQDIQAVVNALWRGGATAVTIQGQRIVSTTGIKCSGSTVTLQGVPYPEPFVIDAVGDPQALQTALNSDSYVELYREQAANPLIAIGWSAEALPQVTAPAYDGLVDLSYAQPITQ